MSKVNLSLSFFIYFYYIDWLTLCVTALCVSVSVYTKVGMRLEGNLLELILCLYVFF